MPLQPALTALFALALTSSALAQPAPAPSAPDPATTARISALLDSLGRVRTPQTVAISPDGTLLAWSVDGPHGMELHLTGIAPKDSVQDAAWDRILSPDTIGDVTNLRPGRCTAAHPAWSPDGRQLAFLSNCAESQSAPASPPSFTPTGQQNLFLWTLATNRMTQISHLHGELSDLQWAPNGQSIAFLFVLNATRRANATDAMNPATGVIGEDHIEVQRVFAVDAASGMGGWISSNSKLHVYEFAWSPDSQKLTYVAADPPGENNWWTAKLYAQAVGLISACMSDVGPGTSICGGGGKSNGPSQLLFDPTTAPGPLHGLQIAVPRFSPDGKHIAFIGGLMSDQGAVGGDVYLVDTPDPEHSNPPSTPVNLTPNRPASPAWLTWLNNNSLEVVERANGATHLTELDLKWSASAHTSPTGQVTATDNPNVNLTLPTTIISGFDIFSVSTSHTDNAAFIQSSFDHPPEVYAGPPDHLQQITHLNDALQPSWGRAESIDYTHDGRRLQGWLLYPTGYNASPAHRYPLIVSVHGGPSSAVTPSWPSSYASAVPFSSLGYFVFLPNPRGSFGQGEAFTQANVKDFGHGDLDDILAGLDVLQARLPIDPARIGITGWSYGGFMSIFAPTQTSRFKAAVAGAGISNWQSYYGENSIDQWMIPFFGASVYDDPAVYARASAINFVKQAHTPTLLLVGDRDGECPAPQSFEYWHALRDLGIPTQLVVYPNEGHSFRSPDHKRDALARTLAWFETYMPPAQ